MTKFSKFKIIFLLILFFTLFGLAKSSQAACGGSFTKAETVITTYDSSNDCVQAAIESANFNDTVRVADGDAIWEPRTQGCTFPVGDRDTYLCIKKAIRLVGGQGVIKFGTETTLGGIVYQPDANSASLIFEFSGFTLDGGDRTFGNSGILSVWPSTDNEFRPGIKIHDNIIKNINHVGIYTKKLVYGVIYHNIFTDVVMPARQDGLNLAWGRVQQIFGTDTNIFVEDNLINTTAKNVEAGGTDPGGGAPGLVFRYNTIDISNSTYSFTSMFGAHGLQSMGIADGYTCPSGCGYSNCIPQPEGSCDENKKVCEQWSTMKVEHYGNKINSGSHVYAFWYGIRGGMGMFFFNKNTVSGDPAVNYRMGYAQYSCDSCASSGSYVQHVRNTYDWSNYANSTLKTMEKNLDFCADDSIGKPYAITENVDYFNQNLNYNGTTQRGVYCGATLPSSCQTGDGAWITTQSCIDLSSEIGAKGVSSENRSGEISGTLYKCTAPNTWTAYYTPYSYPHPLRNESGSDTTAPSAPTGLSVQ